MKRLAISVKPIFLTTLLSALSWSCAKSNLPPSHDEASEKHRAAEGSIVAHIENLQKHRRLQACDRDPETQRKQLEVAQYIDDHEADIKLASDKLAVDPNFRRVELGPIFVLENVQTLEKGSDQWKEYSVSWSSIYDYYQSIKTAPTANEWVRINGLVRGIIPDDEDRLEGRNFYLSKDSSAPLRLLVEAVSTCRKDVNCIEPKLEDKVAQFVRENGIYAKWLEALLAETEKAHRREIIEKWESQLNEDFLRYRFRPNSQISRINAHEYSLALDPGVFADSTESQNWLTKTLEKFWKSETNRLTIQWKTPSPELSDLFPFFVEKGVGGRSFVNVLKKEIHLYSGVRDSSIAHEIGHVLGFPDNYHTVWQPALCQYSDQVLSSDIMSNSYQGLVTSDHWRELDLQYPVKKEASTAVEPVVKIESEI